MKIYILNLAWFLRCDRKNENVANFVAFGHREFFWALPISHLY